jgi:hypothetical protein
LAININKVKYRDIHRHLLDDVELQVLHEIAKFLKVPHAVQTLLCAEKTPTHFSSSPFWTLEMLRVYQVICLQLKRPISICIVKIGGAKVSHQISPNDYFLRCLTIEKPTSLLQPLLVS